mgnify:CR=1 FL=1
MKNVKQSWAIIDENGDEYISASTILFEAAGDVHRAKRIADREARQFRKDHALDGHKITFTVEKRDV